MRRFTTLLLLPAFALLAQAGESFKTARTHNDIIQPLTGIEKASPSHLDDDTVFYEDWESGLNGWVSADMTSTPGTWHIDEWFAYGESGMSWCMGQNPIYCDTVGYNNDWYMVLDSPPIALPTGNVALTFQSRIACELPAGAEPPYNGWDGCNLRILPDTGTTWIVITNDYVEPDYDRSSLYSFGFQHGEGPNVPGWVGQHFDWFETTVDLSPWAGQSVKLRWAFASDPAWCTCDAADRRWAFGWQIDDITITSGGDPVFSNDGTDSSGWHSGTNRPVGGDLWRVADDCDPPPCPPPSGTHYLTCNEPGTLEYNDNMNNEIMSPYIDMRELDFGGVGVDFMVTGVMQGCDFFPDCDFWHWEVTGDSGLTWCYASNPTCEPPPAQNFVHSDVPPDWALYSISYMSGFDVSSYIGSVIRIKAVMESNDDGLVEFGPCFDDITITYSAGFPNDFSCTTLQLRFPTVEEQPAYGTAYFANVGSQVPPGAVAVWWMGVNGSMQRLLPNLVLNPGESDTRDFVWTPAATGDAALRAWSALNIDEDLGNDTSYCRNIPVRDSTIDLELGYDNRTSQYAFNFETGDGALVKFTPEADSIELPFNLNKIRVQFDGSQTESADISLRILEDNDGAPGEGLFWGTITVTTSEVLPNWKEISVDGAPGTHGIDGDFWVWFEVLDTDLEQRFPKIIGDDAKTWDNHEHYFTYRRGNAPQAQPFFFMVRAQVAEGTSDAETRELTPLSYSLDQNYPNPFNPMTEIHYSIAQTDEVSLRVFNLLGQEIVILVDALQSAGAHKIAFDGANLPSGIYLYQLRTTNFTSTRKMVLLK